jgi:hypothetical protein
VDRYPGFRIVAGVLGRSSNRPVVGQLGVGGAEEGHHLLPSVVVGPIPSDLPVVFRPGRASVGLAAVGPTRSRVRRRLRVYGCRFPRLPMARWFCNDGRGQVTVAMKGNRNRSKPGYTGRQVAPVAHTLSKTTAFFHLPSLQNLHNMGTTRCYLRTCREAPLHSTRSNTSYTTCMQKARRHLAIPTTFFPTTLPTLCIRYTVP